MTTRGRPPKKPDDPLTHKEELYVQAIVSGATKRSALQLAGMRFRPTDTPHQINSRGRQIEQRVNVARRLDELGYKRTVAGAPIGRRLPPNEFNAPVPDTVTPQWINRQAQYVFNCALEENDFTASLRALTFIAEFNGQIIRNRPGRPPGGSAVSVGGSLGKIKDDLPQPPAATEDQDFDSFFGDLDSGDGDGDPAGDPAAPGTAPARPETKPPVRPVGPSRPAGTRAGDARDSGTPLSGETEGE